MKIVKQKINILVILVETEKGTNVFVLRNILAETIDILSKLTILCHLKEEEELQREKGAIQNILIIAPNNTQMIFRKIRTVDTKMNLEAANPVDRCVFFGFYLSRKYISFTLNYRFFEFIKMIFLSYIVFFNY